ncbi:MAG: DUF308 domain-containing protein [Actinomycetota bacterium]|nr:DUF308 domain-containing protein [Actinomycetota bacterium]
MSTLVRNGSALALRGGVAIVFGVLALLLPRLTVGVLIAIFAAFTIVYGLIALISALLRRRGDQPSLGELATGLIAIAAGVFVVIWPDLTATGLLVVLGIFAVAIGIAELAVAAGLRRLVRRAWPLALGGLLSIAFGVALFAASSEGAVALAWLVGVYAILFGASLLALGLMLRGLGRT